MTPRAREPIGTKVPASLGVSAVGSEIGHVHAAIRVEPRAATGSCPHPPELESRNPAADGICPALLVLSRCLCPPLSVLHGDQALQPLALPQSTVHGSDHLRSGAKRTAGAFRQVLS